MGLQASEERRQPNFVIRIRGDKCKNPVRWYTGPRVPTGMMRIINGFTLSSYKQCRGAKLDKDASSFQNSPRLSQSRLQDQSPCIPARINSQGITYLGGRELKNLRNRLSPVCWRRYPLARSNTLNSALQSPTSIPGEEREKLCLCCVYFSVNQNNNNWAYFTLATC